MQAQTDRLLPTLEGILNVVAHPRTTLAAVPLALLLAIVCVLRRRRTEVVIPFLVSGGLVLVAIVLIYWNSAVTLDAVLIPALGRIMMGLIVLAWLLVPLFAFAAVASDEQYESWVVPHAIDSRGATTRLGLRCPPRQIGRDLLRPARL